MKLLICRKCGDIFNLTLEEKTCGCGETKGNYINEVYAEYSGDAIPIGISNPSFRTAFALQQEKNRQDKICKPANPECCKVLNSLLSLSLTWLRQYYTSLPNRIKMRSYEK